MEVFLDLARRSTAFPLFGSLPNGRDPDLFC